MTIRVHEVLEGEDETETACDKEDGTDEVDHLLRGAFAHDVEG